MKTFRFEIVSPDLHETYDEVSFLDVPSHDGRMSVLAGHQPTVCLLEDGVVHVRAADGEKRMAIRGGVLSIDRALVSLLSRQARIVAAAGTGRPVPEAVP
jgi:F-type H+-transporting ATPase subunit epsilon